MKLIKYKDMLGMAKEKIKECLAPLRANEMKKKAELEMAEIDGAIAEHEQIIQEISSEYPINFDRLIDAIDQLELVKRRRSQFENIINEMFNE